MIQSEMNLSKQVHKEIRNCALFSILFFLFVSILKKWIVLLRNLMILFLLKDASVWMYRSTIQVYWLDIQNIPHSLAVALGNLSYISARSVLFATMLAFIYTYQSSSWMNWKGKWILFFVILARNLQQYYRWNLKTGENIMT